MAGANPFQWHSSDVQANLIAFSTAFMAAFKSAPDPWAKKLGLGGSAGALKTTWPVPIDAAGYEEFKGDARFRTLSKKTISLEQKVWQDGVEEFAHFIEAQDWVGWGAAPENMALEAKSAPNDLVADLLEAGTTTTCELDGKNFFATDHPLNVFDSGIGTFSNLHAGKALTSPNIAFIKEHFRKLKAPNGLRGLKLKLTHIVVPPDLEEEALDIRDRALVVLTAGDGAVDNRHKESFEIVVADELTDTNDWYALSMSRPGMRPWIVNFEESPTRRVLGPDSEHRAKTGKVAVSCELKGNAKLAIPACIHLLQG